MTDQPTTDQPTTDQPTLPESEHFHGCPADRTESYVLERSDGTAVRAIRCITCGGIAHYENPKEEDHG